jgi:hypothetical protein
LELDDCLQCHERASEFLNQVGRLLQYGVRKWKLHSLLHEFLQLSAPIREQLVAAAVSYGPVQGTYLPEGPTLLAPTDFQYIPFNLKLSSPEHPN